MNKRALAAQVEQRARIVICRIHGRKCGLPGRAGAVYRPNFGRTHAAIWAIAWSASGATPARKWKNVLHLGKDVQLDVNAAIAGLFLEAHGVIEQALIAAHLDIDRWQPGQIRVQRIRQRILQRSAG